MSLLKEKVTASIERLKAFCPDDGYYLAFSGGKDSVVCKALLDISGCKYDSHYQVTSVDPPELVQFIKTVYPDVKREVPHYKEDYRIVSLRGKPITMWNLIPHKLMPPTRIARYCCKMLKETGGDGRLTVTGVRWAESRSRKENQGLVSIKSVKPAKLLNNSDYEMAKKGGLILVNDNSSVRRVVELCYKRHKTLVNPIIDWSDVDVWQFIRSEGIPYCILYNQGFCRLGCIGCPMAGKFEREREFALYPAYKKLYINSFKRMIQFRAEKGLIDNSWKIGTDPEEVFNWWMEYDIIPGQIDLEEYEMEVLNDC